MKKNIKKTTTKLTITKTTTLTFLDKIKNSINKVKNYINKVKKFFGFVIVVMLLTSLTAMSQQLPVNLGTAGDFVLLAKTAISTTGTTHITGDVGVSPAAATFITGFGLIADASNTFSTSSLVTGKIYAASYAPPTPAKMTQAISDMETAYTDAAGRSTPDFIELYGGDLTGQILTPGLYKWSTNVLISSGGVTIYGGPDDIFIFQIAGTVNLASGASVNLVGGVKASNIFWQIAGQCTLETTASIKGIVLCQTAIVFKTGSSLEGRALAQSAITLDAVTALPVELITFIGNANKTNINLNWSTATEINNYGFDIERKQINNWTKIGFVSGIGTSNAPHNYSYVDKNLAFGTYTYRLKQIDNNGNFVYYGSVEVTINSTPKTFSLSQNYPNPFNPITTINYQLPIDSKVTLKIYDLVGRDVITLVNEDMKAGNYIVQFNASGLSSGMYIYRLQAGNFTSIKKLILMK